jgi:hypothetical protein
MSMIPLLAILNIGFGVLMPIIKLSQRGLKETMREIDPETIFYGRGRLYY